jgi:GNAT superfamily N-acetyltransferase
MTKLNKLTTRVTRGLSNRLGRVGIQIAPFYLVREGEPPPHALSADSPFSVVNLTSREIPEILQLDPSENEPLTVGRFRAGNLCFGLRDGTQLVAKMWCDLEYLNHDPIRRKLGPHEGYLFAAYTNPAYRGHDLAPRLRLVCYEELRKAGRTSLISHTVYWNTASRRFKAKLGATEQALYLHVGLFGKWSATWKLRGAHPGPRG